MRSMDGMVATLAWRVRSALLRAAVLGPLVLAAAAAAPAPAHSQAADSLSPALVARGDSIFHGRVGGGICYSCHGMQGQGVAGLGPSLADDRWLHGDGGMKFLERLVAAGVAKPKESAAMMPPFGGTPMRAEQLRAVAAYVRSLRDRSRR